MHTKAAATEVPFARVQGQTQPSVGQGGWPDLELQRFGDRLPFGQLDKDLTKFFAGKRKLEG